MYFRHCYSDAKLVAGWLNWLVQDIERLYYSLYLQTFHRPYKEVRDRLETYKEFTNISLQQFAPKQIIILL